MQENNKIEIKRFDKERRRDFIEMLKGFVVTQVRVLHVQQRKPLLWERIVVNFIMFFWSLVYAGVLLRPFC